MDLATALIWTLRIVLPIIVFCIFIKLNSPKADRATLVPGKNSHNRARMLAHRKAVLSLQEPAPAEIKDVTMQEHKSEVRPSRQSPGKGGGKGGRGSGGGQGRKERKEPRESKEARKETRAEEVLMNANQDPESRTPAQAAAVQVAAEEEKLHLESLLNYVAFNRKEQQRTFILDSEDAPPPPPPPKAKLPEEIAEATDPVQPTKSAAEKANEEAQMVLLGAITFKRVDVAKDIYNQLSSSKLAIFERTFKLIVEAAVLAQDLKAASDFLMKMEAAGFTPESHLLDKVMDLYTQHKSKREQKLQEARATSSSLLPAVFTVPEGPRAKLSSQAPVFVPMGIPPPPPKPAAPAAASSPTAPVADSKAEAAGTDEKAQTEEKTAEPPAEEKPRTKLTAAAKPFEPQCNVVFDPISYTWLVGIPQPPPRPPVPEEGAAEGAEKTGKAKGKGKKQGGKGKEDEGKDGTKKQNAGKGKEDGPKAAKKQDEGKGKEQKEEGQKGGKTQGGEKAKGSSKGGKSGSSKNKA